MLTPAMLRRLLLALIALSLVRVFAVESSAMTNTHAISIQCDAQGCSTLSIEFQG